MHATDRGIPAPLTTGRTVCRCDVRHNCRCPDRTRLPDDYASRGVCVLRTSDASPSMQPTAQAHRTRVCVRAPRRGPGESAWSRSRSEEHTSELQSLMRISYAVFCLKKKKILHSLIPYT